MSLTLWQYYSPNDIIISITEDGCQCDCWRNQSAQKVQWWVSRSEHNIFTLKVWRNVLLLTKWLAFISFEFGFCFVCFSIFVFLPSFAINSQIILFCNDIHIFLNDNLKWLAPESKEGKNTQQTLSLFY